MNERVQVLHGDSRELIKTLADGSIDSVVTDPPYALVANFKRYSATNAKGPGAGKDGSFTRLSRGFMGKKWDTGDVAFDPVFWRDVLRVLKPGGHVVAFGGTRTYHRLACAIEDAGFEIRDQIGWLYGAGFPKSHNVLKGAKDRACQCETSSEYDVRDVPDEDVSAPEPTSSGEGAFLQPSLSQPSAHRAMQRPESQERQRGSTEPSLEGRRDASVPKGKLRERPICALSAGVSNDGESGWLRDGASASNGPMDRTPASTRRVRSPRRSSAAKQSAQQSRTLAGQPQPQDGGAWPLCDRCGKPVVPASLGTALKPAWEPIVVARKPLSKKTVAANVLKHGTGALNIDGCRVEAAAGDRTTYGVSGDEGNPSANAVCYGERERVAYERPAAGRWPANVIHDGSEEVVVAFPDSPGQQRSVGPQHGSKDSVNCYGDFGAHHQFTPRGDAGSAARFFYSAKADADDRLGSKHPTVKPVDLMAYLIRLVTPPGGLVLDPFAGSGTTGVAAIAEGMRAVLIEREAEYIADIEARIAWAKGDGKRTGDLKARRHKEETKRGQDLPLFGGAAK